MTLFAGCIGFPLICVVRHACILEASFTCGAVSLFHALCALSIATRGIELLR